MSWLEELRTIYEPVSEQQEATTKDGKRIKVYLTSEVCHYLDPLVVARLVTIANNKLKGKVSWVVFCPIAKAWSYEDEGRTCRYPLHLISKDLKETIYAFLDDYGSVETFQKAAGDKSIDTQYKVTILFSSEY
jgi:hypothetical protein